MVKVVCLNTDSEVFILKRFATERIKEDSSHQDVRAAKRGYDFEAVLFEHGDRSVSRHISEGRSVAATTQFGAAEVFPVDERISFDDSASLFPD